MNKANERILSRVKKLLALTESPNENEASLAAVMAQELLDKYNLSMAEVEGQEDKSEKDINEQDGKMYTNLRKYDIKLWCGLAKQFDCIGYIYSNMYLGSPKQKLRIVGHTADVEVFMYTYEYLRQAIMRIYKEDAKEEQEEIGRRFTSAERRVYRLSYCMGAVIRILQRMTETREVRLKKDVKCTALVKVRKVAVRKWVDENLNLGTAKTRASTYDPGAYGLGSSRANGISLSRGIGSGSKKRGAKLLA